MQVGFVTTKAADRWFLGRLEKPRSLDVEPFPAALHVPTEEEHLHPPGLLLLLLPPLPTVARGRRSITRLLLRYVVPRESTAVTHTWPLARRTSPMQPHRKPWTDYAQAKKPQRRAITTAFSFVTSCAEGTPLWLIHGHWPGEPAPSSLREKPWTKCSLKTKRRQRRAETTDFVETWMRSWLRGKGCEYYMAVATHWNEPVRTQEGRGKYVRKDPIDNIIWLTLESLLNRFSTEGK